MLPTMTNEEFNDISLEDLLDRLEHESDLVTTRENLKEFAIEQIQEGNINLAAHVLDALKQDDGADYFRYDFSCGTLNTPEPITDKVDIVDLIELVEDNRLDLMTEAEKQAVVDAVEIALDYSATDIPAERYELYKAIISEREHSQEREHDDIEDYSAETYDIAFLGHLEEKFNVDEEQRLTVIPSDTDMYALKSTADINKVAPAIAKYEQRLELEAQSLRETGMILPTVECVWSEHPQMEEGKIYSLAEFDRKVQELDNKVDEGGGYYKTEFHIYPPSDNKDMAGYEGRYDIGDRDGGIANHIRLHVEWSEKLCDESESRGTPPSEVAELRKNLASMSLYADYVESCITLDNTCRERREAARETADKVLNATKSVEKEKSDYGRG